MPFPIGWPARPCEGRRSIRFFVADTATANFVDHAYLFIDQATANPYLPMPYTVPGSNVTFTLPGAPTGTGQDPRDSQPLRKPMIWANAIRIYNDGVGTLEFSFDGVTVQGQILAGKEAVYRSRFEAGIAVRGAGLAYRIEAW